MKSDTATLESPTELDATFAADFLRSFDPDGRHNIVAIPPDGSPIGRTFEPGEWSEIESFVETHNGKANLYFSVNEPRAGAPDDKLVDADIAAARAIHADLDPGAGVDLGAARRAAGDRLAHAPVPPTYIIDSGGGLQAFWKLAEKTPLDDPNAIRALNDAAGASLDGDPSVKNVGRIMRLPFTLNIPTASKLKKHPGRQPRMAAIVQEHGPTHDLAALAAAFPAVEKRMAPRTELPVVELDQPRHIEQARDYLVDRAPEAIEGAGGDETTYRVANACRDYGLSEAATLDLMLECWNEQKASPPWRPEDLADKVANAYRYATGTWGGRSLEAELAAFGVVDLGEESEESIRFSDRRKPKKQILKTLNYREMQEMPDPEWLVEDILQQGTAALMFGQSNAFKSFLGVDLGLSAHTGRAWHGKAVKQTNVMFIVTEGAKGVAKQRVPAWLDYYEVPEAERDSIRMYPQEISLDNPEAVELLIATMQHYETGLAIFDIFGGTMDGTEVEDTTARAWVRNMQKIIRETGATSLTVAHTGWQDKTRARMHTHFWGSFDTRLKVEGDKDKLVSVLSIERHKDADSTGKYGFRLEKTGASLVPVLDNNVAHAPDDLSPTHTTALDALAEAIRMNGVAKLEEGFPLTKVAPIESWRERCAKRGLTSSTKEDAVRKAFARAKGELMKRKLIVELDGHVWPTTTGN